MTAPHPLQRPDIEAMLDRLKATWTFDPALPLDDIDRARSLANQVRHIPLNPTTVEQYAADMERGDTFPPLIVRNHHKRLVIASGNHRDAGHRSAGHTTAPAYIITCNDRTALLVAVEDNLHHGLPTTKAERIDHGLALMASGMSQGDAARAAGLRQPELSVGQALAEVAARAQRLTVDDRFPRLPRGARYALNQITDDDLFRRTASMAAKVSLATSDVQAIVRAVNAAPSHAEAHRLIQAEARDHAGRAADLGDNLRRSSRTARARFDTALTELCDIDPTDVFDTCPPAARRALAEKIMRAVGVMRPAEALLTGKATR